MSLFNTKVEFVGSGKIQANVDTILFEDTFLTDTLAVSEAGHADLDVRFINDSILGALNELLDGLITTSGATRGAELFFTPASGTTFVMEHGLDSEVWAWDMWCTDEDPIAFITPENVYPSGADHVAVVLDQAASGRLVLTVGGGTSPGGGGLHVDEREAIGSIIPDTSGVYDLGVESLRWRNLFATSGTFGAESVKIQDCISITNPNAEPGLTINQNSAIQALEVNKSAGTGDGIRVNQAANAPALRLVQTGQGTSLFVNQTTDRRGMLIQKPSTGGGEAAQIENAGTQACLRLIQTGTGPAITGSMSQDADAVELVCSNASFSNTAHTTSVPNAAGSGFNFASYSSQDGQQFLIRGDGAFLASSGILNSVQTTTVDDGDGILIRNSGIGHGLLIINDNPADTGTGFGRGLEITNNAFAEALSVTHNKGSDWAFHLTVREESNAKAIVAETESTSYTENMLQLRAERTANAAYKFISAFSGPGFADQEFAVDGVGDVTADGTFTSPADYAEYFESSDPSGIEHGYAVQMTSSLIELATSGENLLGFVSARPGVLGDGAPFKWHNKYLMTDFGAYDLDENDDRQINPVWNSGLEYVPRSERPEWVAVGLLGKLWVRTYSDQPIAGDHIALGVSGMMIKATDETLKYRVIASGIPFDIAKGYGTARIIFTS